MDYYTEPKMIYFNENYLDSKQTKCLERMKKILSGILLKSNYNKLLGVECDAKEVQEHWGWSNEDLFKFYFLCEALERYELTGIESSED